MQKRDYSGTILDCLYENSISQTVDEAVSTTVTKSLEIFFGEQKTSNTLRTSIANILNRIYSVCDSIGENNFVGGSNEYARDFLLGDTKEADMDATPALYEFYIQVRFTDRKTDKNKVFDMIKDALLKSKDLYKSINTDSDYDIIIGVDADLADFTEGYYIKVEKASMGSMITVGRQKSGVNESAGWKDYEDRTGKYDDFTRIEKEFEARLKDLGVDILKMKYLRNGTTVYKLSKGGKECEYRLTRTGNYSKKFIDGNIDYLDDYYQTVHKISIKESVTSNKSGLKSWTTVLKKACQMKDETIKSKSVLDMCKNIDKELHTDIESRMSDKIESLKTMNSAYIEILSMLSESGTANPFGTEIGLPIDKENCEDAEEGSSKKKSRKTINAEEGIDASCVNTPAGGFKNDYGEDFDRVECPKCHSINVNIGMDRKAKCSDCEYEWLIVKEEDDDKIDPDTIDTAVNDMDSIDNLRESYDAFKDCKKLPDDVAMRKGLYTDGNGNLYEAPTNGYSKVIKFQGLNFRYNYKNSELEVLDDKKKVLDAIGLSVGNWLDGPDYWIEDFYNDLDIG